MEKAAPKAPCRGRQPPRPRQPDGQNARAAGGGGGGQPAPPARARDAACGSFVRRSTPRASRSRPLSLCRLPAPPAPKPALAPPLCAVGARKPRGGVFGRDWGRPRASCRPPGDGASRASESDEPLLLRPEGSRSSGAGREKHDASCFSNFQLFGRSSTCSRAIPKRPDGSRRWKRSPAAPARRALGVRGDAVWRPAPRFLHFFWEKRFDQSDQELSRHARCSRT
jgi:hypothetical protein